MASETEICNIALSHLGENPILSIDAPGTKVEQLCALHYPLLRNAVLEEIEWSFAVRRYMSSTPNLASPQWGFKYEHTLDNQILRVTFCSNNAQELNYNPSFQWVVEDRKILCDASVIYFRAINQVTDTTKFSPLFVQALAARIAMEMCISVTENNDLHVTLAKLYAAKMQSAATIDNMQGKAKRLRVGRLLASRGGL